MPATTTPQIFFQQWFWWLILLGLLILLYLARSRRRYPPPFPGAGAFFTKHRRVIVRATDLCAVVVVLLLGGFLLSFPVRDMVEALSKPQPLQAMELRFAWSFGLMTMIFWSGQAAFLIGLLSPFHSNLTRRKRIFLLLLCLLPVVLTALVLATGFAGARWSTIQLGAVACFPGWFVNAPAILWGQPIVHTVWRIMRELRLTSSDYEEWR
jgi:hypothetical protein